MSNVEQYLGKKLSWAEIQYLFPESYVALDDYNEINLTGTLVYVTKDNDELWDYLADFVKKNGRQLRQFYTTESSEYNGLWML